jgi:hypothetical protein
MNNHTEFKSNYSEIVLNEEYLLDLKRLLIKL